MAGVSLLWLTIRTGRKPSRIAYPCQKAAVSNIYIFLMALSLPLMGLGPQSIVGWRRARARIAVITTVLLFVMCASTLATVTNPPVVNLSPVVLNLEPHEALVTAGASDLFIVKNASGTQGNMDAAMSALITLMQSHSLLFFKTAAQPSGLIGRNDVVIIKVNGQSPQRGGTNTDLAKSLLKKIVTHPEGFTGEVVIADNGQSTGGVDMAESNAYDHSQSMADVAGMFPDYKVSAYSWYAIAAKSVNEYVNGDYTDGYVVNSTANGATGLRVSYPKFRTAYGTYISFKRGVWSQLASSYDSTRLKIINLPMFKSHYNYGATACVKNYMGVGSQTLTGMHNTVGNGGMGTQMVETRFPTLNIIDCIWINANPFESGSACGPFTTYDIASYTNLIGASTDPVALEYWAAKHVAIPAAIQRGYSVYASIDPDYAPIKPGLTQSYHNYLMYSMNVIRNSGRQATMSESEMNVYIGEPNPPSPILFSDGFESGSFTSWSGRSLSTGETATATNTFSHHGLYSAKYTSNGSGGIEYAYCYKNISSSELYGRGYFYVSQSGIVDESDRFFFLVFKAGTSNVAYAGWRKIGGVVKWVLTIRHGTGYVDVYSAASPSTNRWYCVELHWKQNTVNGMGELYVNGVRVCSITGRNTAAYGDVNQVRFGLPEIYRCAATTAYSDCAKIAFAYIGPEPSGTVFANGFESGSFSGWTGTSYSSGETRTIVTAPKRSGSYSARFTANGGSTSEYSYCYKTVTASSELYSRGYFYVSQSGIVQDNDRFYFTIFSAGGNLVAYAGWRRISGEIGRAHV